jgi:hypothetical protein
MSFPRLVAHLSEGFSQALKLAAARQFKSMCLPPRTPISGVGWTPWFGFASLGCARERHHRSESRNWTSDIHRSVPLNAAFLFANLRLKVCAMTCIAKLERTVRGLRASISVGQALSRPERCREMAVRLFRPLDPRPECDPRASQNPSLYLGFRDFFLAASIAEANRGTAIRIPPNRPENQSLEFF